MVEEKFLYSMLFSSFFYVIKQKNTMFLRMYDSYMALAYSTLYGLPRPHYMSSVSDLLTQGEGVNRAN